MIINKPTIFLKSTINQLQKALDNKDKAKINEILSGLYNDYDREMIEAVIAYNNECGIHAADLVAFRHKYPNAGFMSLFLFEESLIKTLCQCEKLG